jgi:hypothetical protein
MDVHNATMTGLPIIYSIPIFVLCFQNMCSSVHPFPRSETPETKEHCLLEYEVVWPGRSLPTFLWNVRPPT